MKEVVITGIEVEDRRFDLENGAGSDAVHTVPVYAYAVCRLKTNGPLDGVGLAFTLGSGNDLVCRAIEYLSESLVGREIHELMSEYGAVFASLTDSPCYRWLGPHKGVVHLALASITNACFDLWAKAEDVPLWKLLIGLRPEQILSLLDFRYVEDLLTKEEALRILRDGWSGREERETVLRTGYRGYDTSVGWFNYPDDVLAHQTLRRAFHPIRIALGEHVPNKVIFKNYLQAGAMDINQVDAVRVGGISEFILISLMSKKMGVPVIPHVGDMGQIHQHMVLFNHIAVGHPSLFLEAIPHLRKYFRYPVQLENGYYAVPQVPGSTCDFLD